MALRSQASPTRVVTMMESEASGERAYVVLRCLCDQSRYFDFRESVAMLVWPSSQSGQLHCTQVRYQGIPFKSCDGNYQTCSSTISRCAAE